MVQNQRSFVFNILDTWRKYNLTYLTVGALPASYALLVSIAVAVVVTELVVTGSAELGACGVVIVDVTLHPHPVGDPGRHPHVVQGVPLRARQDDAGVGGFLYQLVPACQQKEDCLENFLRQNKIHRKKILRFHVCQSCCWSCSAACAWPNRSADVEVGV